VNKDTQKFLIAFAVFFTTLVGYGYYSFTYEKARINEMLNATLERSAAIAHRSVGDEYHDRILKTTPTPSEEREMIRSLSDLARIEGVKYVYSLVNDENNTLHFTSSSATDEEIKTGKNLTLFYDMYEANPEIFVAMKEQRKVFAEITDQWGHFRSIFMGYTTKHGIPYVIGVDIDIDSIQQLSQEKAIRTMVGALIMIMGALPLLLLYRQLFRKNEIQMQYQIEKATADIKTARDDAIAAMHEAQEANRAKDSFLSSMSHELRTPLNAIIGFSQVLLAKPDTASSIKPFIEKILFSGKNLLTLVDTILDFSKIEAGKMVLTIIPFNVGALIEEVEILTEPMAQKKGLTIESEWNDEVNVYADRQLIKQVLVNLLVNAIKFSPENETIVLRHVSQDGNDIFSISDHGRGISQEKIAELFEPFSQIREHQNHSIKGTGLGLAIVKKIVELHSGEVWIESVEGEGSCFYFSVPREG
jgi:signal transduction histidine kinase